MQHRRLRRKLGVKTAHRKALLRNLAKSLVQKKRITTTYAKAKEASAFIDKLVTVAKKGTLHSRRQLIAKLGCSKTANMVITSIAPKFGDREGGYTRVLKLGPRPGDGAEKALLEFTAVFDAPVSKKPKKKAAAAKVKTEDASEGKKKQTASENLPQSETQTSEKPDAEKKGGFMGKLRKFLKGD